LPRCRECEGIEIRGSKFETRYSRFEVRNSKFVIRNSLFVIRSSKLDAAPIFAVAGVACCPRGLETVKPASRQALGLCLCWKIFRLVFTPQIAPCATVATRQLWAISCATVSCTGVISFSRSCIHQDFRGKLHYLYGRFQILFFHHSVLFVYGLVNNFLPIDQIQRTTLRCAHTTTHEIVDL